MLWLRNTKKKQEKNRVDNAAVISRKKMFDIIGQSKFYSRNNDDIHETNLETRFSENCLWIRVNEHVTSDVCYRVNPDKYKICQVVSPVNQYKIMTLNSKKNGIKSQDLAI